MFNENLDSYMFASYETSGLACGSCGPLFKNTPVRLKSLGVLYLDVILVLYVPAILQTVWNTENIDVIFYLAMTAMTVLQRRWDECTDENLTPKTGTNTTCPY